MQFREFRKFLQTSEPSEKFKSFREDSKLFSSYAHNLFVNDSLLRENYWQEAIERVKLSKNIYDMLDYGMSDDDLREFIEVNRSKPDDVRPFSVPSAESEDQSKLKESYDALIQYLTVFGFDPVGQSPTKTLLHWQLCSAECGWQKFLKYKLAAFYSCYMKNELPPKPFKRLDNPNHLIGGRAGRFIFYHINQGRKKSNDFAYGLLQCKKGFPRASESQLKSASMETFEILTTEKKIEPVVINGFTLTSDHIKGSITEVITSIFGSEKYDPEMENEPHAPSLKGNYVSGRNNLGTYGTFEFLNIFKGLKPKDLFQKQIDKEHEVDSMYRDDLFGLKYLFNSDDHYTTQLKLLQNFKLIKKSFDGLTNKYHESYMIGTEIQDELNSTFKTVLHRVRRHAMKEKMLTSLVPLAEPLKVRVISKGPPLRYFLLKPLQKFLHGILRKHPVFHLIGSPVTSDYLEKQLLPEGDFLSVDYKSATDLLDPGLSRFCVERLVRILAIPSPLSEYFLEALIGHEIQCPMYQNKADFFAQKCRRECLSHLRNFVRKDRNFRWLHQELSVPLPPFSKRQVWGQLMGSIVSFPILCIINASLLKTCYDMSNAQMPYRHSSIDDCPFGVNGDDGVIRCNKSFPSIWFKATFLCGFEPSVGKTYLDPYTLNINSTSFTRISGQFIENKYLNMGLMMGMTRSCWGVEESDLQEESKKLMSFGQCSEQLIQGLPLDIQLRSRALRVFLKRNWVMLEKTRLPWFLPQSMGGLGIISLDDPLRDRHYLEIQGFRFGPSDNDLLKARYLSNPDWFYRKFENILMDAPMNVRQRWSRFFKYNPEVFSSLKFFQKNCCDNSTFLDTMSYYLLSFDFSNLETDYSQVYLRNRRLHRVLDRWITKTRASRSGFDYLEQTCRSTCSTIDIEGTCLVPWVPID